MPRMHRYEHCAFPRFFKSRWQNRVWVCSCGRMYRSCFYAAGDSGFWGWEELCKQQEDE